MTIYTLARLAQTPARSLVEAVRAGDSIGLIMYRETRYSNRVYAAAALGLDGWPACECTACGCAEPATTTDDACILVCDECADYTTDDDGDVHCSRCDDVEVVIESCGAGNQTRSYARLIPPVMPDADQEGEWACYWDTVGDDDHVVSRHATREQAEQAVAAHDWPPPGDNTRYLCSYVVRCLVGGRWQQIDDYD